MSMYGKNHYSIVKLSSLQLKKKKIQKCDNTKKTKKESACSVGDLGSIPGLGRCPWRREGRLTPVPLLFGLAFQLQRSRPPLCKAAVHGLVTAVASVVAELSL